MTTTAVKEPDMLAPRYFCPIIWEDGQSQDEDHDMHGTESQDDNTRAPRQVKWPFSVENHTARTIHTLTRSLIDIEDTLDEERLASSPRTHALTPSFARTYPWSDDPLERGKADRKVEWEGGEGGFREWFVTADGGGEEHVGESTVTEGCGNGSSVALWDWMSVEGRRGRMDVKCLECEREWVLMVRERGLTI